MDTPSKYSGSALSLFPTKKVDYIFIAFAASLMYTVSIFSFGPGITNDSVNYLSAAATFPAEMKKADGSIYTEWPPLFPVILSAAKLAGINFISFFVVFTGCVYVSIHIILVFLFQKLVDKKAIYILAITALLFSTPILQMHVLVWSESLFMLLVLLHVMVLHKYYHHPSKENLMLLIVAGIFMYLQRKSGILFILPTAFLISWINKNIVKRIVHALAYTGCCFLPIVYWYIRRYSITGKIAGSAFFEPMALGSNLMELLSTFSSYFFPSIIPLYLRCLLLIAIAVVMIMAVRNNPFVKKALRTNVYFLLCLYFTLFYYAALLMMLVYLHMDEPIDDRILSPVYPLLLIQCIIMLNACAHPYKNALLVAITAVWLLYPLSRTLFHMHRWNTIGTGGYNTAGWRDNKIIAYCLQSADNTDTLYTNSIYPLKYFLNFKSGKRTTVLPQEDVPANARGYWVCLSNDWIYPANECQADESKIKRLIVKTEHGDIWQLSQRQK